MVSQTSSNLIQAAASGTTPAAAGDPASAAALSPAVLETIAARFRPAGLLLAVFRADGSLQYADPEAAGFFQWYVLPALQQPMTLTRPPTRPVTIVPTREPNPAALPQSLAWREIPGVVIAGFAHAERRHAAGMIVLAGRGEDFSLSEDVLRDCSRLAIDSTWLESLAGDLPAYGVRALERQVRQLMDTFHDQLRINGLERELNTLSQQLADTYEELSLIYQVSSGMKVNRSAGDFFRQACLDAIQVMDVRGMGVALKIDMQNCPPPAIYGRSALPAERVKQLSDELLAVLRVRKSPLLVDQLKGDKHFNWLSDFARQLLAVPLMRQDQVLGCLFAVDKEDGDFDSVDSKLLNSIANESAIYLENATLFDDVHGLMMGLLHSLTSAVDAKDAYTCGHSERVALLSRNLAQQTGMSDADVEQIYMAGLLHDVGKIGVPESVLQKAGRLTPEEFEHMKKHPEIGARILADVKQLKPILPGVLHHHERYDGKGYPHGLSGECIPLMGRIICLADCFDAMTSNRTYRRALPIEVALTEIRRCSGTQFDPSLAEAFLRMTPEGLRDLLHDHKEQSKRLLDMQENLRGK